jgi:hypothetical protein
MGTQLSDDAGDAAGFMYRTSDAALEVTNRGSTDIAGSYIGPGSATLLLLTGDLAALAGGIGGRIEVTIIAAEAVCAEFNGRIARLDDPGAPYAGDAT